jgi:trimethylamine--corrinoid protein Co-methyltransferase
MAGLRPLLGKPLKVLSDRDVEAIHSSSLRILEEVGTVFHNAEALQTLSRAGCRVAGSNAKFPQKLIERAIKRVPSSMVFKARDPAKGLHLGSGMVHLMSAFGASFVREPGTNVVRPARLKDLEDFTRVFDYLEGIDCCLKAVIPQDVPPNQADIYAAYTLFANTDKNIHISQDCPTDIAFITRKIIELGEAAALELGRGNSPIFSLGCCPDTPLQYGDAALTRMKIAIEAGIPFLIVSGAIAGVSAPVTIAGLLATQHAELLAGLGYAQLLKPGCEVAFGSFASSSDMKTGKMRLGSIEQSLIGVATQQLCDHCGICYGYGTGALTDSELLDIQAGYDKGISLALQMLGGVDMIHDVSGLLASAMVMSLEDVIIDHEYARMIARGMKGIEVSPETLALDLIRQRGPGASFLAEEHTLNHFQEEFFLSDIFVQKNPAAGTIDEAHGMRELALKKARSILASHRPTPPTPEAAKRMKAILEALPAGGAT